MQLTEITKTVNEMAEAWEEFKVVNDRRLKDIECKGRANILDDEHISRLNNALNECKSRINRIENANSRPQLDPHSSRKNDIFQDYLRKGVNKEFLETKSFYGQDPSGVPLTQTIYDKVMFNLTENSTVRKIASVDTISTDYITLLQPDKKISANWGGSVTDEALPEVTPINVYTYLLHACPTITIALLEDVEIDIEEWVVRHLSDAFSTTENKAFFDGDGNNKPRGFLENNDIKVVRTASTNTISSDDILSLYYDLDGSYSNNASFIMHRSTIQYIRSIKSTETGQYIWQPGLQDNPDTLLGAPVYQSTEMPEIVANARVIAFGDFKRGYKIVDRTGISILRDQFSYKPNIAFYATKRVGGEVIDPAALRFLRMAAS